jgi:hypothetical protein
MRDGHLTRETVDRLAEWLPRLREVPDASAVTPRALFSLVTLEMLCILVERKVLTP